MRISNREGLLRILRENLKLLEGMTRDMPDNSVEKNDEMSLLPAILLQVQLDNWLNNHSKLMELKLKSIDEKKKAKLFVERTLSSIERKKGTATS